MEITEKEYEKISPYVPLQRGNVEIPNIVFLNALLYAIENGCKWRKMPDGSSGSMGFIMRWSSPILRPSDVIQSILSCVGSTSFLWTFVALSDRAATISFWISVGSATIVW